MVVNADPAASTSDFVALSAVFVASSQTPTVPVASLPIKKGIKKITPCSPETALYLFYIFLQLRATPCFEICLKFGVVPLLYQNM